MSGPNTIGVRGPMPGSGSDHTGTCPCDRCNQIGDPDECVLCLALVERVSDDGLCEGCAAGLEESA